MSFGAYLVGSWENRFGINTTIQIINPTTNRLQVTVAFLDNEEEFLECVTKELSANDVWEIFVPRLEKGPEFGVVKAISHWSEQVKSGIVGFKRHFLVVPSEKEAAFSESPLAAVPKEIAVLEYNIFREKCHSM